MYTVTPDVTPWMGVPVGVLVYPNSESFRIGLGGKFTNVTVEATRGEVVVKERGWRFERVR